MAKRKSDNLDGFKPTHIEVGFNNCNHKWEPVLCFMPGAGMDAGVSFDTSEEATIWCATNHPTLTIEVTEAHYLKGAN